jgi:1-deoxy-D-xylulose-5-phosphate reductoisomerase
MGDARRRRVVVLGSTGSIGTNTLDVLARHRDGFQVHALAAGRRVEPLAQQVRQWHPSRVAVRGREEAERLRGLVGEGWEGEILWGEDALSRLAADPEADIVVNALVGARGLPPSLAALRAGHRLALANKESLVVGGELVREALRSGGGELIPVDSEHHALFLLLQPLAPDEVRRLILTASGGALRDLPPDRFAEVTPQQALQHPTWRMGPRVTVDSATLMNKGLEIIEAQVLFDVDLDKVEVWIHPQSIVHALVELVDGSLMAQLSQPDMRIPIQSALTHPRRRPGTLPRCDLPELGRLEFARPDPGRYPCLELAREAARRGGLFPAVLNAADEVAVGAFLRGQLSFPGIPRLLEHVLGRFPGGPATSLEAVREADRWARDEAQAYLRSA